jgi:hypothetical protein
MKIIRVQYTVKSEFVEQNRKNIRAVMAELNANPIDGLRYSTYLLPDGVSFMHLSIAKDAETSGKLGQMELFKIFQAELRASEPLSLPKPEELKFVGAGFEILASRNCTRPLPDKKKKSAREVVHDS